MRKWTLLLLALATLATVTPELQRPTARPELKGAISLHRRHLRQIGDEDNTAILAEEEERQQELEEEEADWEGGTSKLTSSRSNGNLGSNTEEEEAAEGQDIWGDEEKELEEEEAEEEELYNEEYNPRSSDQLSRQEEEAFEEEEELEGGQQGDDGLLDFSGGSTQAKQEEEEAGKASQSAVQESLAKLNPTKNSTKAIEAEILGSNDDELEKALEVHRQGESQRNASSGFAASTLQTKNSSSGAGSESNGAAFEESVAQEESLGKGSTDTLKENSMKTSNVSIAALANDEAPRNVSIMAQGAILGTTIGGMVKDNSSSIAGVVGLVVAGAAGVAVAFAGISLYQRFRNRRSSSKSLPRIIEIGALANRKPKSPSYARVNDKNQDNFGSSGAQWPENESAWDSAGSSQEVGPNGSAVKHKKAWDWDADW